MFREIYESLEFLIYGILTVMLIVVGIIILPYIIKFIISKLLIIPNIIKNIKIKQKQNNINFDEFDNIENISKQTEENKKELEYEYNVLKKVYNESFVDKDGDAISDITFLDLAKAHQNVEEAKKDLYDSKILNSIEVEECMSPEGTTINAIKEERSVFDTDLFKNWSKQIFRCIKQGTEEEIKLVENFMTDQIYDRLIYQMKQFEEDDLKFITEDLIIEEVSLIDYGKAISKEEIKVLIKAKMKEYIIEKTTNKVVRGNSRKYYSKKIIMTFLRQHIDEEEGFIRNCPNCGAETSVLELGRCRYCNTLIFPIRYNWTLTKFETM